jgi:hypothetical protein
VSIILWPIGSNWVTGTDGDTLHAVPTTEAISAAREPQLAEAVCGAEVVAMSAWPTFGVDRRVVAEWPPFAKHGRCVECYQATGRPKVGERSHWRGDEGTGAIMPKAVAS